MKKKPTNFILYRTLNLIELYDKKFIWTKPIAFYSVNEFRQTKNLHDCLWVYYQKKIYLSDFKPGLCVCGQTKLT